MSVSSRWLTPGMARRRASARRMRSTEPQSIIWMGAPAARQSSMGVMWAMKWLVGDHPLLDRGVEFGELFNDKGAAMVFAVGPDAIER